ncbi:MAG: hypothetical protein Q9175_004171 [Cornicularia normoerica]
MSHSLDASSPEGRQTWMELGRVLRDEGITPAMIQKNRALLVKAMKSTLSNETILAESMPQSYATAPEYHVDDNTTSTVTQQRNASHLGPCSALSPTSLLGSALPRSASFMNAFLERHDGAASSLDQKQNIDDGMRSLLRGMNREEFSREYGQDDVDYIELEDFELEEALIDYEGRQSQDVHHVMEPLGPTLKPGEFTEKLEVDKNGVISGAPKAASSESIEWWPVNNEAQREHDCDAAEKLSNHSTMRRYQQAQSPDKDGRIIFRLHNTTSEII